MTYAASSIADDVVDVPINTVNTISLLLLIIPTNGVMIKFIMTQINTRILYIIF